MSEFIRIGYRHDDLASLNIMRMYKMTIHLSDIVMCDGKSIKSEMLTNAPGHSGVHKFPAQKPTKLDMALWVVALQRISSEFYVLTLPLKEYIGGLYFPTQWRLSSDGHEIHYNCTQDGKEYHEVYIPNADPLLRQTRSGRRYKLSMTRMGSSTGTNYASITESQQYQVLLHSSVPIPVPSVTRPGFEKNLGQLASQSLWSSLEFDGDGSWILEGMIGCSLVIVHDGSYMKEISPTISSAATMIYCTVAKA